MGGEILSVGTQISIKGPKCGGDFLTRLISGRFHTTGKGNEEIRTQRVSEETGFLRENPI